MTKFKENWHKLSKTRKSLMLFSLILACGIIILCVCGLLRVLPLESTNLLVLLLLGGNFFINSILYKGNKVLRILLIGCAVFILFSVIVTLVPKIVH